MISINPITQFEDILRKSDTYDQLIFYLSTSLNLDKPYVSFRELLIISRYDLNKLINYISRNSPLVFEKLSENMLAFKLEKVTPIARARIVGCFVITPTKFANLFRVLSVSESDFWNKALLPLFTSRYPHIVPVYIQQKELEEALRKFEKMWSSITNNSGHLRVHELTTRTYQKSQSNPNKKFLETKRAWTNLELNEVFDEINSMSLIFSSIFIGFHKGPKHVISRKTQAKLKIWKRGYFSYNHYFQHLHDYLFSGLEANIANRFNLLKDRSLAFSPLEKSTPLEICYEEGVFTSTEAVRSFGEILDRYPDSSQVVFHANPYYHANIADLSDGSSFELWILSEKRIMLCPQGRTTEEALTRITNYIFEKFREGQLTEYELNGTKK